MAEVIKKTKNILNAYLTLGLLEDNKEKGNSRFLSQQQIMNTIDKGQIEDRISIGRFIDDIRHWLEFTGLTEEQTNNLIKTEYRRGSKLIGDIPRDDYEDYVAILLFLNLIEDNKHKEHLSDLRNRDEAGDKPLSLITKLTIAKRKREKVILKLADNDKIIFKPNHFQYIQNKWCISGVVANAERILELSEIYSAEPLNT